MVGVTFGNYHSFNDFGLLLADVSVEPPAPQRFTVEVPGRNGILDLTPALTDKMRYGERYINLVFNVIGPCIYQQKLSEIANKIHGQTLNIIFDSDPAYYWRGFVTVDAQSSDEDLGQFDITIACDPFKYSTTETTVTVEGDGTATLENGRMEVTPTITTTAEATLTYGDITTTVSAGTHILSDLELTEGETTVTVTSTGTTTFTYRQGEL